MKWLGYSVLTLCLAAGCEKETPFEITKPVAPGTGSPLPGPSLDAGAFGLDAQVVEGTDSGPTVELPVEPFTKAGLLKALADCSLSVYREFNERALALRDATAAWSQSPTVELQVAAQAAWRAAMSTWQRAELMRFGPAGSSIEPGGRDLRSGIYFFPDLNNCLVDQRLVGRSYENSPLTLSFSEKGLGALEYLLFYTGEANSCSSVVTINTPPSAGATTPWAAIDATERNRRRAAYAAALGADLSVQASALLDAWDPAKGNFHAQLSSAGAGSQAYATEQDAFNVVDNALFYFDKELKSYKVALPVGLEPECMEGCAARVESRFSLASSANIVENIRGFRLFFQGCGPNFSGLGFDDYLRAINHADLADRMVAGLVAAEQSASTLPQPLEPLILADPARVRALHTAIKVVTDLFKADFLDALNLELPAAAAADND